MSDLPPEPSDYSESNRNEYFDNVQAQRLKLGQELADLVKRRRLGERVDPDRVADLREYIWQYETEALRVNPQADSVDGDGPRP